MFRVIVFQDNWKFRVQTQKKKKNLPVLENKFPFRLSKDREECDHNCITPKYTIEYLPKKLKNRMRTAFDFEDYNKEEARETVWVHRIGS